MMEYMSVQEKYSNGKGQRNIVQIRRNGTARKTVEKLGSRGRVLKRKTRRLSTKERRSILKGVFVPGLWRNCQC